MKSRKLEHLHPDVQPLAQAFLDNCAAAGLSVFIYETFRSAEYQNELYAQSRTQAQLNAVGLKHVVAKPAMKWATGAVGGSSEHNKMLNGLPASRAFDFAFSVPAGEDSWHPKFPWQKAGAIGKALGLTWGGDWTKRDMVHFELPMP